MEFLLHPMRHILGDILIVWHRLTAPRSRPVRIFIEAQEGRIEAEWLPAYAPELNPAEYHWGQLKHHELPNFCPRDRWHLGTEARRRLRHMQRRPFLRFLLVGVLAAFQYQGRQSLSANDQEAVRRARKKEKGGPPRWAAGPEVLPVFRKGYPWTWIWPPPMAC